LKRHPTMKWGLGLLTASVVAFGYIHNFVYPRTEGEKLEALVDEHHQEYREDIKSIRTKIDKIYELVLKK